MLRKSASARFSSFYIDTQTAIKLHDQYLVTGSIGKFRKQASHICFEQRPSLFHLAV